MMDDPAEIFAVSEYQTRLGEPTSFEAWHLPRKHWVRKYHWNKHISVLLDGLAHQERPFLYLGLPGDDLLDLRYFHDSSCRPRARRLRFLGFNSSAQSNGPRRIRLDVALDEVRRLPFVDDQSEVLPDSIQQLGKRNSLAWMRAVGFGTFDVVNWDLCDGLAAASPSDAMAYYNALNSLLSLQSRRLDPWLLFVTTRVGERFVAKDSAERLLDVLQRNLNECEKFEAESAARFGPIGDDLREHWMNPKVHVELSVTGIFKWILQMAARMKPPTRARVKEVASYRVERDAPHEDLVSLVIEFKPLLDPPHDPIGLAQNGVHESVECDEAVRSLRRVGERTNVDAMLRDHQNVFETVLSEKTDLMLSARFDANAYREWALSHHSTDDASAKPV